MRLQVWLEEVSIEIDTLVLQDMTSFDSIKFSIGFSKKKKEKRKQKEAGPFLGDSLAVCY